MNDENNLTSSPPSAVGTQIDLGTLQQLWDVQFKLNVTRAQNALNLCLHSPSVTTLASLDHAAVLLNDMKPEAEQLAQNGRPLAVAQLAACVQDICEARNTLAKTLGLLAAADQLDSARLSAASKRTQAVQTSILNQRNTSANVQANEVRKLL